MNALTLRIHAARTLRGLGYGIVLFQWFWLLIVGLPQLVEGGTFDSFTPSPLPPEQSAAQNTPIEPNAFTWVAVVAITAFILAFTVLTLIRLPKKIARGGDRIVTQTVQSVVPVITHHRPIPAKKRRELSRRVTLVIQLAVASLPVLVSLFLPPYRELTGLIIITLSVVMAVGSLSCFLLAWLLQPKRLKKPAKHAT